MSTPTLLSLAQAWHEDAVKTQRMRNILRIRSENTYTADFWQAVDFLASKGWNSKAIAARLHTLPEWQHIKHDTLTRAINRHRKQRPQKPTTV